MADAPLVSVVIPAYNADATLDETLRSVRSQTHQALEIIVVDDGSTDDTGAIAARHAEVDDRIQIVRQDNAGLAAARNQGWRRARADLIAFLDADDLWAPTTIERQVHAFQAGEQDTGLAYCWSVRIDSQSIITGVWEGSRLGGCVLEPILAGNFVGNGSASMVRRQALIDAEGFDSGLRAAGAEGCEDWLTLCRVAEKYGYACVPEHLIGYRYLPNNMSSNRPRMLRSWLLAHEEMLARQPDHGNALKRGVRNYGGRLVQDALSFKGIRQVPPLLLLLFRRYPSIAATVLLNDIPAALIGKARARLRRPHRDQTRSAAAEHGQRFVIGNPDTCR